MSKTYIGDGIYAEILLQTRQIRVTTENGLQVTNEIYFEDETITQFLLWLQSLGIELPKK